MMKVMARLNAVVYIQTGKSLDLIKLVKYPFLMKSMLDAVYMLAKPYVVNQTLSV